MARDWIDDEFEDRPNTPFEKDDQERILNILRDNDSEEALKEARISFERHYGYKPSV